MADHKTSTAPVAERETRKGNDQKPSYIRRKRPPKRLSQHASDIYVNRSSQFGSQFARCNKLLDQGFSELTIHGLGSAIHRAINIALMLKESSSHCLEMETTTSTVELIDDLEPVDDDTDYRTQTRPNSAIHIRLFKNPSSIDHPSTPLPSSTPLSDTGSTRDGSSLLKGRQNNGQAPSTNTGSS